MMIYQHDIIILRKPDVWYLFCDQCSFSAEYNGKGLKVTSIGDETARHKGIYFELTENNEFMPVYLVKQIDEIIRKAG